MIFGILNIFTLVLVSDLKLVICLVNQDRSGVSPSICYCLIFLVCSLPACERDLGFLKTHILFRKHNMS